MSMEKKFLLSFRDVVREELLKRNSISIDPIGIFKTHHVRRKTVVDESGMEILHPPRDEVRFVPQKSASKTQKKGKG